MKLSWREAVDSDLGLLAEWNHQLIHDEGHRNPMNVGQLTDRMKTWLQGEYRAMLFSTVEPVAYALFTRKTDPLYLRQLFVARDCRRQGIGRAAMSILRDQIWPKDVRLTVEVLCANHPTVAFWRSVGFQDYSLLLEFMPS
jgi:GNAT superfamily N-acetyltransferase